jgi:hypothetical protein
VEYSLTPLGREAAQRLEVLVDWIEENFPLIQQAQQAYAQKRHKLAAGILVIHWPTPPCGTAPARHDAAVLCRSAAHHPDSRQHRL